LGELTTAKVYGGAPPAAVRVQRYVWYCVVAGQPVVVKTSGPPSEPPGDPEDELVDPPTPLEVPLVPLEVPLVADVEAAVLVVSLAAEDDAPDAVPEVADAVLELLCPEEALELLRPEDEAAELDEDLPEPALLAEEAGEPLVALAVTLAPLLAPEDDEPA
jgi:hypothetical protein